MSQDSGNKSIRFLALLFACLLSTFSLTSHAAGILICETVSKGYAATVVYDCPRNSPSATEDAARSPTAAERHAFGVARPLLGRVAGFLAADTTLFSSNLGSGGSRASAELLNSMRSHGRTITIATEGSEELRFLDAVGAEASVGGPERSSIILRENPSKVGAMEEFLHGTQERLGIIERRGIQGAEDHVTDFLERHRKLLGLDH